MPNHCGEQGDARRRNGRCQEQDTGCRCEWSLGVSDAYQAYHDEEWGVPVRDDRKQFEFLILEGAQAGPQLVDGFAQARRLP